MVERNPGREQEIRDGCTRIWPILLDRARNNARCISYTELAEAANVPFRELRRSAYLRRIHRLCSRLGIAYLDVLVVTEASWAPSRGYRTLRRGDLGDDYPGDDDIVCADREWLKRMDWLGVSAEPGANNFVL